MSIRQSPPGPLGYQGPLDYQDVFPLLGIPVCFRSNDAGVLESVDAILGRWKELPAEMVAAVSGITVDIIVQYDATDPEPAGDFHVRVRGATMLAGRGGNLLWAGRDAGYALAYVTPGLAADEEAFAWYVVESLALYLVTASLRVPFHAAAVTDGRRGAAFFGRSGAGKSTLAYACARKGCRLLSEEAIFVDMGPAGGVWGNSRTLHLNPDAGERFPELRDIRPRRRPNGKLKIPVPLGTIPGCTAALRAESLSIMLLEPAHDSAGSSVEEIAPQAARHFIMETLEPGFDLDRDRIPAALDRLLAHRVCRLSVGHDLDAAVDLITDWPGWPVDPEYPTPGTA